MFNINTWKEEAVKEGIKYVVLLVATTAIASVSSTFRARVQLYDPAVLALFVLALATFATWDFLVFRKSKELRLASGGYLLSVLVFVILTAWGRDRTVELSIPVFLGIGVLVFSKLSHLTGLHHSTALITQHRERIGYATTGIVICEDKDDPYFLLVLNLNLRDGKGLWVPPGGHFTPHVEVPDKKLLQKIKAEIGLACEFLAVPKQFIIDRDDFTTDQTAWLRPPVFLLDENLMGRCSQGHELHIDYVYIVVTKGQVVEKNHKYSQSQQLRIPVRRCRGSANEAENAVGSAIDKWHIDAFGAKAGLRDTLTRDVSSRLHLAAEIYLQVIGAEK
jgi:hypothetical protein